MSPAFVACGLVTAASAFISLGFSIAAVRSPGGTLALYSCARSVALAAISVVPFLNGSVPWLEAIAGGMVIVQALDAAIGVSIHDRMKTLGPAGTAATNIVALLWLIHSL